MAFEKMGSFTFNHADQADELNLAADTAKQKFDSRASELKTAINKVVDLLNATTDGASGADNVGAAAISGVTGTTVQAQMKSMKGLVDGKAASGHNHDSSYSSASHNHDSSYAPIDLAGTGRTIETVKGNADDLAMHLADTVSDNVHGMGSIATKEYEEGIWTPTLEGTTTAGNHTYSLRQGCYVRIGSIVCIHCNLVITQKDSSMEGDAVITGLPFTAVGAPSTAFSLDTIQRVSYSGFITAGVYSQTSRIALIDVISGAAKVPINADDIGQSQIVASGTIAI